MNETANNNTVRKRRLSVNLSRAGCWKRIMRRLEQGEPFIVFYRPNAVTRSVFPNYRWLPIFRARFCVKIPYSTRKQWRSKQVADTEVRFTPIDVERGKYCARMKK
jgi:hypothetical protein